MYWLIFPTKVFQLIVIRLNFMLQQIIIWIIRVVLNNYLGYKLNSINILWKSTRLHTFPATLCFTSWCVKFWKCTSREINLIQNDLFSHNTDLEMWEGSTCWGNNLLEQCLHLAIKYLLPGKTFPFEIYYSVYFTFICLFYNIIRKWLKFAYRCFFSL